MKRLLTLLLLLPLLAFGATNNYNIGDQTNITGGSFTNATISGTTTLPSQSASTILTTNASRLLSPYSGTTPCTNQFMRSLSAAGVAGCATVGSSDLASSLTLVTPTLGIATATTINGNTITTGTGTLTLGAGKALTSSNTLTLAGTDGSTLNVGTGGTLGTAAYTASTAYLARASNLSDLTNTATARTNIGLGVVENTALSTWAGSTNLTTLGTIASGTWNATAIGVTKGGVGLTGAVTGLLLGNGSSYAAYAGTSCTNQFPRSLSASGVATCASVANADLAGSIAASKLVGSDIATVGTITSGTWSGTTIGADKGGTGVANNIAATLTRSGSHALTLTTTNTTSLTLPTSGTVAVTSNKLSAFAATTSSELAGTISDAVGTAGNLPFQSISTWTPNDASGASLTFTTVSGQYIRIGDFMTVFGALTYPSTVSGSTAVIGGLPCTARNIVPNRAGTITFTDLGSAITARVLENTTNTYLYDFSGGNKTNAQMSLKTINFTASYICA